MGQILLLLAFGLGSIILYITMKAIVERHFYEVEKSRYGCGEAIKYPHKEPIFGLDLLFKSIKEHEDGVYLQEIQRQYALYGKTHEIRLPGKRMIRTMDSKNIQTVLGLNSKDYGLQPPREGFAMPLFGHGINTTDGEYWQYSRSLVKPTFSRAEICNFESMEFHFKRLQELLPTDGATVDLHPLFSRLF